MPSERHSPGNHLFEIMNTLAEVREDVAYLKAKVEDIDIRLSRLESKMVRNGLYGKLAVALITLGLTALGVIVALVR